MSESNYEGYCENEGNLAWNEFDWQEYLNQNKREIRRFLRLYQTAESSFNPFEIVTDTDEDNTNIFEINQEGSEFEIRPGPYTIHKHPLFIVAKGLTIDICESWEELLVTQKSGITPIIAWKFARTLQDLEYHINGGIYGIDINEASLAIAHLKNGLSVINETIRIISQIGPSCQKKPHREQFDSIKATLFNIRGAVMRILDECREYEDRNLFD